MGKMPKERRRFCPFCGKHTIQMAKEEKKGKVSAMKAGHRKRQRRIDKGYGGFPYEDPSHRTRGKKSPTSKKKQILFKCKECNKSHKLAKGLRTAKLELV